MKRRVHEESAEDEMEPDLVESEECVRQHPPKRTLCQECSAEGDRSWQEGCRQDQLQELWAQEGIDTRNKFFNKQEEKKTKKGTDTRRKQEGS